MFCPENQETPTYYWQLHIAFWRQSRSRRTWKARRWWKRAGYCSPCCITPILKAWPAKIESHMVMRFCCIVENHYHAFLWERCWNQLRNRTNSCKQNITLSKKIPVDSFWVRGGGGGALILRDVGCHSFSLLALTFLSSYLALPNLLSSAAGLIGM